MVKQEILDDPFRTSGFLDEAIDLLDSPIWRLALYRLNGWPRLPVKSSTEQAWRPWHRWFGRRDRDYNNPLNSLARRLWPRF